MGCSISFPITCDGCDNKPHIGGNGNWYVGDTDTGVKAQGPAGQDADPAEFDRLNNRIEEVSRNLGTYDALWTGALALTTSVQTVKLLSETNRYHLIIVQIHESNSTISMYGVCSPVSGVNRTILISDQMGNVVPINIPYNADGPANFSIKLLKTFSNGAYKLAGVYGVRF